MRSVRARLRSIDNIKFSRSTNCASPKFNASLNPMLLPRQRLVASTTAISRMPLESRLVMAALSSLMISENLSSCNQQPTNA